MPTTTAPASGAAPSSSPECRPPEEDLGCAARPDEDHEPRAIIDAARALAAVRDLGPPRRGPADGPLSWERP